MYMGLFVRDECERSVKNQASKDESVEFVTNSQEATREKATCEAHDWKLKNHVMLSSSRVFCEKGHLVKYPRNSLFGKNFISLPNSLPTLYIPSLSKNCIEYFSD